MAVRIGIVGAGGVAERHARVLEQFEDVRVVGVADVDPARAEALAARHDARVYADHDRMLADAALDALYVCVPPFAHGPAELAAIAAGLPFFVEKPVALDEAVGDEVSARLAERPVITATGYHWRGLDTVEQAWALLREHPAGLVVGSWFGSTPPVAWWSRRDRSGGQTIEQTTHVLDLARALVGEVDEVAAVAARRSRGEDPTSDPTAPDVPEVTAATLRFASGAIGSFASTCLLPGLKSAGLAIYADGLALELSETALRVDRGQGVEVVLPTADPRVRVDRDFVAAVRDPDRASGVLVDYDEALRTHRLACAVVRSAEEGRPVRLGEGAPAGALARA